MGNSCRMNSVLILVFNILASSLAEPDPDQHIHVHLQPEDSKGGQSPKAAGGVLVPEDGKGGEAPKTGGGHLADYGGWTPKRCHPHCMPNCHSWCVPPKKTWEAAGGVADYGSWTPKKCHPYCMPNCHSWCVPPKKNLGSRRGGCRLWQLDPKKMPPILHAKLPLMVRSTKKKPGKLRRWQGLDMTTATGLQNLPATVPAADPATVAAQPAHPHGPHVHSGKNVRKKE